jgi:hypothetical protein
VLRNHNLVVSRSVHLSRALAVTLSLVFAAQMTFVCASTTSAAPLPSEVAAPKMEFANFKANAPLLSQKLTPRKQPRIKRNHRSAELSRVASHGHFRLAAKGVKSRRHAAPDCQGCKDDCLAFSLECIGLSMLGGCGPCAAICLAEQIRCQLKCPCAAVVISDN